MSYDHELRYSDAIRTMLNSETTLVSNRMNWMILLQALLFTAASNFSATPTVVAMLAALGIGVSIKQGSVRALGGL
jgi:hypothetical protein